LLDLYPACNPRCIARAAPALLRTVTSRRFFDPDHGGWPDYGVAMSNPAGDSNSNIRRLIVGAFETLCLLVVVIPTVVAIGLWIDARGDIFGALVLAAAAVFLVSSFLAGGALTLLDIAHNTRLLANIADDVHRMQRAELEARNQAAVRDALSNSAVDVKS
jgi:hypothetical protein